MDALFGLFGFIINFSELASHFLRNLLFANGKRTVTNSIVSLVLLFN